MQVATSASATEEDASEEERLVIGTEDASEEARLMHQQRERLLEEKAKKKVRDLCLNVVMACARIHTLEPIRTDSLGAGATKRT